MLLPAVAPHPTEAAPAAELCTLTVSDLADAHVKGATVQIDGKVAGTAPMTIQLPAGEHLVVVLQAGFSMFQRNVTLRVGHAQALAPTLAPAEPKTKSPKVRKSPAPIGNGKPPPSATAKPSVDDAGAAVRPSGPPPATRQQSPRAAATAGPTAKGAMKTAPAAGAPTAGRSAQKSAQPTAATAVGGTRARGASEKGPTEQTPGTTPTDASTVGPPPAPIRSAPVVTATEPADPKARQMQLTRGARILGRDALVWDLGVGYPHYIHLQGTAGMVREPTLAIDASLWVRSNVAITEGGLRMRMRIAEGGPFSAVAIGSIGGGGGLGGRDSFAASFGLGGVIVIAERFALGARAMVDIWSDRLCPEPGSESEGEGADVCQGDGKLATAQAIHEKTLTNRDTGAGLTLSATLEIALSAKTQLFLVVDVAPGQSERPSRSGVFNDGLILDLDPGYAGRAGFSFVF